MNRLNYMNKRTHGIYTGSRQHPERKLISSIHSRFIVDHCLASYLHYRGASFNWYRNVTIRSECLSQYMKYFQSIYVSIIYRIKQYSFISFQEIFCLRHLITIMTFHRIIFQQSIESNIKLLTVSRLITYILKIPRA